MSWRRGGGGVPEDETEDGVKGGGGRREGEGLSMYYKILLCGKKRCMYYM